MHMREQAFMLAVAHAACFSGLAWSSLCIEGTLLPWGSAFDAQCYGLQDISERVVKNIRDKVSVQPKTLCRKYR